MISYPIRIDAGDAIDVAIRFAPKSFGAKAGKIRIDSNDPASPHFVDVSGFAPTPRLSLVIANSGGFGKVCVGRFADEPLVVNNSGKCPVAVFGVTSSSSAFLAPEAAALPLLIAPGELAPAADPLRPHRVRFGFRRYHSDEQRPRQSARDRRQRNRPLRYASRDGITLLRWR